MVTLPTDVVAGSAGTATDVEPIVTRRVCGICRQPFTVSAAEWQYLHDVGVRRGWPEVRLPRMCTPCRRVRRLERFAAFDDGRDDVRLCVDCDRPFTWSSGEKRYYAERAYAQPRRCPRCRPSRTKTSSSLTQQA